MLWRLAFPEGWKYEGQNAGPLGRLGSGEDDFGQAWDSVSARDAESVAKVVPERDFRRTAPAVLPCVVWWGRNDRP